MIKNKKFKIQQEDEEDFEAFLKKLNKKRQDDIGGFLNEHSATKKPVQRDPYDKEDAGRDKYLDEPYNSEYNLTKITERSKEEPESVSRKGHQNSEVDKKDDDVRFRDESPGLSLEKTPR